MNPDVIDVTQADFATEVEAESHRRPVLVDYWAAWCGPCKALAPILTRVVAGYQGRLRLAKLDTDANQPLATQHGIRSLPTVRLFRDGRPVAEFMGAQPEQAIREFIEQFAEFAQSGRLAEARACIEAGQPAQAKALLSEHLREHPGDEKA